jgi:hypothetical protein
MDRLVTRNVGPGRAIQQDVSKLRGRASRADFARFDSSPQPGD